MLSNADWDVIVVGAGVSGCMAAVAAARNGAKTLLVERDACLGGTLSNSMVGPMMTFHSDTEQVVGGLAQEVVDRLVALGGSPGHILDSTGYVKTITPFDHEILKLVLQRMVLESGASVLLHSLVEAVIMDVNFLKGIEVRNKGGQEKLLAQRFVDASGDGDVSFLAGAPWQLGRLSDGLPQPVSLIFKLTDVDLDTLKAYLIEHPEVARLGDAGVDIYNNQKLIAVCAFNTLFQDWISTHGLKLQREHVLVFSANHPNDVIVNMTRAQDVNPLNAWDLTRAELETREQIFAITEFLTQKIPGFANARLISSGNRIGVRESRRIMGEYVLDALDIKNECRFPDAIARSAYPIDIHAPSRGEDHEDVFLRKGAFYEIPYRCLVPLKVENLLISGRCISTTHEANASTRVSPNCMAIGQAAGTASALSIREHVSPRYLDVKALQKVLVSQQALLGPIA
ncbi:MAG: FAD-dependent oxidoreductase [Chloroflexota bacterium]